MLKIKADRSDRELVQSIAAEYIDTHFQQLKGEYEVLMLRLDKVTVELSELKKQAVTGDDLIKEIEMQTKTVDNIRKVVTDRLDTYENERIGIIEHRLSDVEDQLGI